MAATLAFFSATRLAMRTLKGSYEHRGDEKMRKGPTRIRPFAPSGVRACGASESSSDGGAGGGGG
jgi:hypothetical protein